MERLLAHPHTPKMPWRIVGGVTLALALTFYRHNDGNWLAFALLLLAPDLGALGYLVGARAGARGYNLLHNYPLPLILLAAGLLAGNALAVSLATIWLAHIGMDRLVGYTLKPLPPAHPASVVAPAA